MTAAVKGAPKLKRRIGLGLLTLYGVGVMVGAGVYVLIGEVAALAGEATPLAFMFAGAAAAFSALSFAELSARRPESAGEAAYARAAFGSLSFSVLIGVAVAGLGILSGAAVLRGGVGYLQPLVGVSEEVLILGLGAALTIAAIVGVLESLALAALLTLVEIGGLLLIAGAGLLSEGALEEARTASDVAQFDGVWTVGLTGAVFLAFFAFIGFEDMVNMVEETKTPERTMPRAIIISLCVVCALYALVSWASVRAVGAEALGESKAPLTLVWRTATGLSGAGFSIIAVAAAANGILAQMVMAARIGFGLGRTVPALAFMHETHPRFGTPVRATLIAAAATVVLALAAPVEQLAAAATFVIIPVFAVMNVALLILKRRGPAPAGAFSIGAWVPAAGLVICVVLFGAGLWSRLTAH